MSYGTNISKETSNHQDLINFSLQDNRGVHTNRNMKNKRNLELNLEDTTNINGIENYNKKVDSPIVKDFFEKPCLTSYESELIDFISSENQYYMKLRQICANYYGVLEDSDKYTRIFSIKEKQFIFGDCLRLQEISYRFLKTILENLTHFSAFKHKSSIQKFQNSSKETNVLGYDISQLVLNADVSKINMGELINKMFGQEYRLVIILYMTKYSLKVSLLNGAMSSEKEDSQSWLQRANKLSMSNNDKYIIELISAPIERLFKYPTQIKALVDKIDASGKFSKLGLNISLVKVNQIIQKCYLQDNIVVIDDIKKVEKKLETEFHTKIAYDFDEVCLDPSKDIKLGGTSAANVNKATTYSNNSSININDSNASISNASRLSPPVPKISTSTDYQAHLLEFSHKYDYMKKLVTVYTELIHKTMVFMESQITYSNYWVDFLEDYAHNDTRFFGSIYSIYSAKLTDQIKMSRHFQLQYHEKVLKPLLEAIDLCEPTKRAIVLYQKLKDSYKAYITTFDQKSKSFLARMTHTKAQSCKEIMEVLRHRLPEMLILMDSVIDLTFHQYLLEYPTWLYRLIGDRSWNEFQHLSRCHLPVKNHDIVEFYNQAMAITHTALYDQSHLYSKYLPHLLT